ncbi:hypothetical protein [Streptomyces sp. CA-179760]|uniref:hypothetical protein n=1 Tax=Streptomyces sp. CA-179760 TaxID=3240054 RepID=UPI003D945F56
MDLTPYVDSLRHELAVAAEAGGDDARALAERLTAPLESAARLTLLDALSAAMGEVTRELAPGSVDVRLRGSDPEFVVAVPHATEPFREAREPLTAPAVPAPPPAPLPPPPPTLSADDDGTMARINFRLPAQLKTRAEEAAAAEGLSVNAWLVRGVSLALDGAERASPPGRGEAPVRRSLTGWVH